MEDWMVVLTRSSKYGNNCVAGINMSNGAWVRLVTDDEKSHGGISDEDLVSWNGKRVDVLDVIDAPILGVCNDCIQPENVLLDRSICMEIIGTMTLNDVLVFHPLERKEYILGNAYRYITEERVNTVGCSLTIVEVSDLVITQEENLYGQPKTRARFIYQGIEYKNMAVTDYLYYSIIDGSEFDRAVIVVSIGTPYNGRYYKYVSAIFV